MTYSQTRPTHSDAIKDVVRDESLTWAARGLLAYMLSMPEDRVLNEASLLAASPMGREHLRGLLRELEAAGYLTRKPTRRDGQITGSRWELFIP